MLLEHGSFHGVIPIWGKEQAINPPAIGAALIN